MSATVSLPELDGSPMLFDFPVEGESKRAMQWAIWTAAGDLERAAWRAMQRPQFEVYREQLRAAYADALRDFAPWPMGEAV